MTLLFTTLLLAVVLLSCGLLLRAVKSAPEASEDETGFIAVSSPRPVAPARVAAFAPPKPAVHALSLHHPAA